MVKALGLAVLGGLVLSGAGIAAYQQSLLMEQRILPNVEVARQPVAGLSTVEARQKVQQATRDLSDQQVTVTFEGRSWTSTASALGFAYDIDGAVRSAAAIGHEGGPVGVMFAQLTLLRAPARIAVNLRVDDGRLGKWVQDIAAQVDRPVQNADLAARGSEISIVPGQDGRQVEQSALVATVKATVEGGRSGPITVPVKDARQARTADQLQPAAAKLKAVLRNEPLRLKFEDKSWDIKPSELAPAISWKLAPTPSTELTIGMDQAKLRPALQKTAAEINRPVNEPTLAWNGSGVSVAKPSQEGRQVDIDTTLTAIADVLDRPDRSVPLPVKVQQPKVTTRDVQALGIKELVAEGASNFSNSSANRVTNVKKMASLLSGVVIPPGEEFSFNEVMGDISPEEGWAEGLVISNGRTVPGLGGGICQVSTTAFRAAFWAGLPITERHDHAYPVPYYTQGGYPEGFDATVWSPDLDFKFKNDTPGYLLIQTTIDAAKSNLKVSIYGTKVAGRLVKMEGPFISNVRPAPPPRYIPDPTKPKGVTEQTDYTHDGMNVLIRRVITDGSGTRKQELFSQYQPWPATYVVGTR